MNHYSSDAVRWATTGGGPLVLLPISLLCDWPGCFFWCDEPENETKNFKTPQGWLCFNEDFLNPDESDYGRACAVKSQRAFLSVAHVEALVLENEDNDENPATWFGLPDGSGVVICQWNYCHSAKEQNQLVQELVNHLDRLDWKDEVLWPINHEELVLFDSAIAGVLLDENDDHLYVPIQQGNYSLTTAQYHHANDLRLLTLHRLRRLGS